MTRTSKLLIACSFLLAHAASAVEASSPQGAPAELHRFLNGMLSGKSSLFRNDERQAPELEILVSSMKVLDTKEHGGDVTVRVRYEIVGRKPREGKAMMDQTPTERVFEYRFIKQDGMRVLESLPHPYPFVWASKPQSSK